MSKAERIKQYVGNYDARNLAAMLVELEDARASRRAAAPEGDEGAVAWGILCVTSYGARNWWKVDISKTLMETESASLNRDPTAEHYKAFGPYCVVPLYASRRATGEDARMAEALTIVAKATGYECAWLAPSGTPNIILERAHPTEAGKIQVTRLDIAVSHATKEAS